MRLPTETGKNLKYLIDMTLEVDHIRSEMMCLDNVAKISPDVSDVADVRRALMAIRDLHDDVIHRLDNLESLMDGLWKRLEPPLTDTDSPAAPAAPKKGASDGK